MNLDFVSTLGIGAVLYVAATVAVIALLKRRFVEHNLGIFYWTRYSLLMGAILVALPLLANFTARSILYGLLVLEHVGGWDVTWKFALVTWASFMAALMVVTSYRVISHNSQVRFVLRKDEPAPLRDEASQPETWTASDYVFNRWIVLVLLGLWIPAWCGFATHQEYVSAQRSAKVTQQIEAQGVERPIIMPPGEVWWQALDGALLGSLIVTITLYLMGRVQHFLFSDEVGRIGLLPFEAQANRSAGRTSRWLERFLRHLGPGYTYAPDATGHGGLRAGHPQLTLLVIVLVIQYVIFYAITWTFNLIPTDGAPMSAIFFLLTIIALMGFILTGLSFYLDYFRIPTLLFVFLMVLIPHVALDTNHYFELNPHDDGRVRALADRRAHRHQFHVKNFSRDVTLDRALSRWEFPTQAEEPGGTLVVVAAAGGGIQAAAWTAQVLTGLDEALVGFGESIGLVSGVSGGSVGLMYYLQLRNERKNDPNEPSVLDSALATRIREMAESSSLEATAWGMAFPDLIRFFFPPAVHDRYDRGWSLELDWRKRLGTRNAPDDTRFSDWAEKIRHAKMAIPAFNAALADLGSAMILSPVVDQYDDSSQLQLQLQRFYPNFTPNPRITTAARLSATFSYVSPICKPLRDELPEALLNAKKNHLDHRIADGGYVDNSGLLTATRWTKKLIEANWKNPQGLKFRNVIFVRIQPFPEMPEGDGNPGPDRKGLLWETLGPLLALNSARGMSQETRGDWELELIVQAMRDHEDSVIRQRIVAPRLDRAREEVVARHGRSTQKLRALQSRIESSKGESIERLVQQAENEIRNDTALSEGAKSAALESLDFQPEELSKYRTHIYTVTLQPPYDENLGSPPLSWKLAPSEKQMIRQAWAKTAQQIQDNPASESLTTAESLKPEDLKRFFRLRGE